MSKLKSTNMQQSQTTTKPEEQSNTQFSADTENSKNSPLLMREEILNTPFVIVGNQEAGYHITWGKFRFNEELIPDNPDLDLQDIAQLWITENHWSIVLQLISIGMAANEKAKK